MQLFYYPSKIPHHDLQTPYWCWAWGAQRVVLQDTLPRGGDVSKQEQHCEIGLLSPQNKGWGVQEGFVDAGWEMQDQMQQPV